MESLKRRAQSNETSLSTPLMLVRRLLGCPLLCWLMTYCNYFNSVSPRSGMLIIASKQHYNVCNASCTPVATWKHTSSCMKTKQEAWDQIVWNNYCKLLSWMPCKHKNSTTFRAWCLGHLGWCVSASCIHQSICTNTQWTCHSGQQFMQTQTSIITLCKNATQAEILASTSEAYFINVCTQVRVQILACSQACN